MVSKLNPNDSRSLQRFRPHHFGDGVPLKHVPSYATPVGSSSYVVVVKDEN